MIKYFGDFVDFQIYFRLCFPWTTFLPADTAVASVRPFFVMGSSRPRRLTLLLLAVFVLMTPLLSYTTAELLSLSPVKRRVPLTVYHKLKQLGICVAKPTRRGHGSPATQRPRLIPVLNTFNRTIKKTSQSGS